MALYDLVRPARRKTWVSPVDRLRQAEEARERRLARGYAKEAKRTLKRERKEIERGVIQPLYPSVWTYPTLSSNLSNYNQMIANTTNAYSSFTAATQTATNSIQVFQNQWVNQLTGSYGTTIGSSDYTYLMDGAALYDIVSVNAWSDLAPITPEEADRRLQETRARARKAQIVRARAVKKGRSLLVALLDDAQKWSYAKTGAFLVEGADGKTYRLRKNGTTHELGVDGTPLFSHCIHLSHSFIAEDSLIACKLLLETDPGEFHRIANTSPLRYEPLETPSFLLALPAEPIYALAA